MTHTRCEFQLPSRRTVSAAICPSSASLNLWLKVSMARIGQIRGRYTPRVYKSLHVLPRELRRVVSDQLLLRRGTSSQWSSVRGLHS